MCMRTTTCLSVSGTISSSAASEPLQAKNDDPLFDLLRDLTMRKDPGAPVDPTLQQKLSLESRQDKLDALQKTGAPKVNMSRAKAYLESLRQRLYTLVVAESREKYFAEAARLRSRGLSTSHLQSSEPPPSSDHVALHMDGLMDLLAGHASSDNGNHPSQEFIFDDHAEERSEKAMDWLLNYMSKAWSLLAAPCSSPTASENQESPGRKKNHQRSPLASRAGPTSSGGET
ncbi:unnamed protein product [Tuber aestivum]|uniref:Uncharacterized protein n=1 Tax=Tuber aestivum TaxID=59557 RepID=A0A292PW98_9PEZI|nr:unnamed protein product [Tuber aestivum]